MGDAIHGRFVELTGAAELAPADLQAKADRHQAFKFVRLEDIDYDRRASVGTGDRSGDRLVYFVDTGNINAQCGGTPCDLYGSIYSLRLNPADPTRNARLVLLERSEGADKGWASPDNIAPAVEAVRHLGPSPTAAARTASHAAPTCSRSVARWPTTSRIAYRPASRVCVR